LDVKDVSRRIKRYNGGNRNDTSNQFFAQHIASLPQTFEIRITKSRRWFCYSTPARQISLRQRQRTPSVTCLAKTKKKTSPLNLHNHLILIYIYQRW
ncbi:MAG: hypothetical protein WCE88_03750, partial [Burkholderiales bacterium]